MPTAAGTSIHSTEAGAGFFLVAAEARALPAAARLPLRAMSRAGELRGSGGEEGRTGNGDLLM